MMEISKLEQMTTTIKEQGEIGFTKKEIIENLKAAGTTHEELKELKLIIQEHAANPEVQNNKASQIFSIIISLVFIARGINLFNRGFTLWAVLLIAISLFGIIFSLIKISKNRKKKAH